MDCFAPPPLNTINKTVFGLWPGVFFVLGLLIFATKLQATEPKPGSDYTFIDALLIDREAPRLGIKWTADIFVDAPLNDQPGDTGITLRRAQLAFYKSWGDNWSAKLTADYNNVGKFQVNDNYLLYSGWQTAIIKFGIFDRTDHQTAAVYQTHYFTG